MSASAEVNTVDPEVNAAFRRIESPGSPGKTAKVMRYKTPALSRKKALVPLAKSDTMLATVQVVKEGGETGFHSHTGMDGFWFVLKGRARFYTGPVDSPGNELIAEVGPHEGVFLPRGVPYWFEQTGEEELEILQVEAFAKGEPNLTVLHGKAGGSRNMEIFAEDGRVMDFAELAKQT